MADRLFLLWPSESWKGPVYDTLPPDTERIKPPPPPTDPSNRGVVNRSRIRIDWLQVTLFPNPSWLDGLQPPTGWDLDDGSPNEWQQSWERNNYLAEVLKAVSRCLGCDPADWAPTTGSHSYRRGLVGPGGALVLYDRHTLGDTLLDDIHVKLDGDACGRAGSARLREFIAFCNLSVGGRGRGRVKRLDLAMDDLERVVIPGVVCQPFKVRTW